MESDKTGRLLRIVGLTKGIWNVISADIGWLACIAGAAQGHPWLGLVVVPILFGIHITVIETRNIRAVFMVAVTTMAIGFITDSLLIILGIVEPNRWIIPAPFTTLWDIMIWANFSLMLDASLRFLQKKPLAAAFLGALSAPGAYYAGDRLGALNLSEPLLGSLLGIGVVWFFVMPCLSLIAKSFYHPPSTKDTPNLAAK
ncbi:MAG: DUF2878 domain-containing protein [Sedimentisphaerales bacterium]|nr:DUF2878 domain-containing protein [Sedimentisphaerales bacterium]